MSYRKLKVLVADDAGVVHAYFRQIAQRSAIPFDVVSATDGRRCMDLLNAGGVDLAFIDVNMPELSGMQAVEGARYAGDKTFVTLMSAAAGAPRLRRHALLFRVYELLHKPFAEADVQAILQTYRRITAPIAALIVDDSSTVRHGILKVLTGSIFNIDVTEARDGQTALADCLHGRFDVIFLDCNMPGLNGLQTLELLVAKDHVVKVIMMSGEHNEGWRRWALDRGAAAFLYKPFSTADVDRELHALFGLKAPELRLPDEAERPSVITAAE